jgi:hypothetical protein
LRATRVDPRREAEPRQRPGDITLHVDMGRRAALERGRDIALNGLVAVGARRVRRVVAREISHEDDPNPGPGSLADRCCRLVGDGALIDDERPVADRVREQFSATRIGVLGKALRVYIADAVSRPLETDTVERRLVAAWGEERVAVHGNIGLRRARLEYTVPRAK